MKQELRASLRRLIASPAFTLVAILTLALGIAANAAMFSVLDSVLLAPLPYPEPGDIVFVRDIQPQLRNLPGSYPEYLDWKELEEIFEDVGAYWRPSANLTGDAGPERVEVARLTPNLLRMMGVVPLFGRLLEEEDDRPGAERVTLLGHGLWQRRFGGDAGVLGRTILIDGEPTTVVGILPLEARVQTPNELRRDDPPGLWLPLRRTVEDSPRGEHYLTVVARLSPGVSFEQAESAVARYGESLKEDGRTEHDVMIVSLDERIRGGARASVLMLMGAVGFVLLIACANVANLLLARSAGRGRELALRSALGASRARLVRGALAESLILAAFGGTLGIGLAYVGLAFYSASPGTSLLASGPVALNLTVLGFSVGLTVVTGLLFGALPALRAGAVDANRSLKEGARQLGAGGARSAARTLVVTEVALALVLLVGSGLLIQSFLNLLDEELGFDPESLLTFRVALPEPVYDTQTKQSGFFDDLVERLEALPGVEAAAIVTVLPTEGGWNSDFDVEGHVWPEGHSPLAETRSVSPGYFEAMRIPLVEGRFFTSADNREAETRHVIVNLELVRQVFGESPARALGRRVYFGEDGPRFTIVGVVADVQQWRLGREKRPAIYRAHRENMNSSSMYVVARTEAEPLSYLPLVREAVRQIDRNQPVSRARAMEAVIQDGLARRRFSTSALTSFAGLALFLACIGLYGVLSQMVGQRRQEFGLRMTLGARGRDILELVLFEGGRLVGVGLIVGLVAAAALARVLQSSLFGVSTADFFVYAQVCVVLVAVAALALYLPARRASRVDPMVSLRYQ